MSHEHTTRHTVRLLRNGHIDKHSGVISDTHPSPMLCTCNLPPGVIDARGAGYTAPGSDVPVRCNRCGRLV